MALPVNGSTHLIPAYYSYYRPRKDERLSWPSWLTCSGWFTHISRHPSAAGRAQDRESSPARDRRSTTVPRHQHYCYYIKRHRPTTSAPSVRIMRSSAGVSRLGPHWTTLIPSRMQPASPSRRPTRQPHTRRARSYASARYGNRGPNLQKQPRQNIIQL